VHPNAILILSISWSELACNQVELTSVSYTGVCLDSSPVSVGVGAVLVHELVHAPCPASIRKAKSSASISMVIDVLNLYRLKSLRNYCVPNWDSGQSVRKKERNTS